MIAWFCDACGADLTPTRAQLEHLRLVGNPIPRKSCPRSKSGLHRVSRRQIDLHAKLERLRMAALERAAA